ncbi:MAG: quinone-dependent dihydroorotate dehydrogenase [Anaerolineales bacterium]
MKLYPLLRPLLFRLPPERAHALTLRMLGMVGRTPRLAALLSRLSAAPARPVQVAGLTFPNPVGLAAGYDKDGAVIEGLAALGFGHLEIGTVTPRPQPGNPKPRVFRLPEERAIINRMGFPSAGAQSLDIRLRGLQSPLPVVLGVNIGKNKDTPNEEAVRDYLSLMERFIGLTDYLTVNISSPNTVGLRDLQHRAALERLLGALHERRRAFFPDTLYLPNGEILPGGSIPIFVKLAPDLTSAQLDAALEAIVRSGMDGVILTNTTVARPGVEGHPLAAERGGLSGAPLRAMSEAALRHAVRVLDGRLPVVSTGGIMTPEDARRRLDMGAALVQLYTGLIYAGPFLPRDCVRAMAA